MHISFSRRCALHKNIFYLSGHLIKRPNHFQLRTSCFLNWDSMVPEWDSLFYFTRWVPGLTMTICNEITVTVWFTVNKTPTGVLLIFLPLPSPQRNFHDLLTWQCTHWKENFQQKWCCTILLCKRHFFLRKSEKNLFILLIYILAGKGTF